MSREVEERVKMAVREQLARANALLAAKHGIDPTNEAYREHKRVMRYANDHHVSMSEAVQMMRKERKTKRRSKFEV